MSAQVEESLVGVIVGSPSDLGLAEKIEKTLKELGVSCEVKVLSAHRTPDLLINYVKTAESRGLRVLIACAGMAAHLAGAVAANTLLPVIGVPIGTGTFGGLDALLSTVQMPPGVPVATVGVDAGKNAALLAARILAIYHPQIREALEKTLTEDRKRYENF